ncbi:hypothetical protein BGAFAR04_K0032 (plasmid) [Borreliella garinii Far04]|nr:hypothetical protein BGAFAR04_K0032 [Borreliella garinii Far04]
MKLLIYFNIIINCQYILFYIYSIKNCNILISYKRKNEFNKICN